MFYLHPLPMSAEFWTRILKNNIVYEQFVCPSFCTKDLQSNGMILISFIVFPGEYILPPSRQRPWKCKIRWFVKSLSPLNLLGVQKLVTYVSNICVYLAIYAVSSFKLLIIKKSFPDSFSYFSIFFFLPFNHFSP